MQCCKGRHCLPLLEQMWCSTGSSVFAVTVPSPPSPAAHCPFRCVLLSPLKEQCPQLSTSQPWHGSWAVLLYAAHSGLSVSLHLHFLSSPASGCQLPCVTAHLFLVLFGSFSLYFLSLSIMITGSPYVLNFAFCRHCVHRCHFSSLNLSPCGVCFQFLPVVLLSRVICLLSAIQGFCIDCMV